MNTSAYTFNNTKKTVSVNGTDIMVLNLSHPVFDKEAFAGIHKGFVSKINRFYEHTAEKYTKYVCEKYPRRAAKIYAGNGGIKLSFLMNCTVSLCKNGLVCIFTDLTYFDGKKKKTARLSQCWSAQKSAILPSSLCFERSGKSKKYLIRLITDIAEDNMKKREFSYYSGFHSIISRRFDFDNFYFVPGGAAFFYNAGVLSEEDTPCVFVIPYEKIDGIMKIRF